MQLAIPNVELIHRDGKKKFVDAIHQTLQNQTVWFLACCILIITIGAIDTWLVVKYSDSIFELEQNPICLYLISLEPYELSIFIAGKMLGLGVVICTLVALFTFWKDIAMTVTYGVTMFQIGLLSYLYVLSDIPHMILRMG